MKRELFPFLIAPLLLLSPQIFASEICRLDVAELEKMSTFIVIGQVVSVASDKVGIQEARVSVRSFLKGKSKEEAFAIRLLYRGVKDFDPELKQGDLAVFFLKSLANGRAEKAYHGSIALFTKPNFK